MRGASVIFALVFTASLNRSSSGQAWVDTYSHPEQEQLRRVNDSLTKTEQRYFNCSYFFEETVTVGGDRRSTEGKLWARKSSSGPGTGLGTDLFLRAEMKVDHHTPTFEINKPGFSMTGRLVQQGESLAGVATDIDPVIGMSSIVTSLWFMPGCQGVPTATDTIRETVFTEQDFIARYVNPKFESGESDGKRFLRITATLEYTDSQWADCEYLIEFEEEGGLFVVTAFSRRYLKAVNAQRLSDFTKNLKYRVDTSGFPVVSEVQISEQRDDFSRTALLSFSDYDFSKPDFSEFEPVVYGINDRGNGSARWGLLALIGLTVAGSVKLIAIFYRRQRVSREFR